MVSFSKGASGGRTGSTRDALTAESVWKPYGWLRKALSWPAQDAASAAVPWLVVRCCELCLFFFFFFLDVAVFKRHSAPRYKKPGSAGGGEVTQLGAVCSAQGMG